MERPPNGSFSNSTAAELDQLANILGWVTFAVGLPAICLAIYMLSQLVKGGNGSPVQAINLLISDIFNLFTRPQTTNLSSGGSGNLVSFDTDIPSLIFYFGVASNITFLVGVAQERHLLVAGHQCHGACRRARKSSAISLLVWAAPVGVVVLLYFGYRLAFSISLLLPLPLLLFFLLDASRAVYCCPVATGSMLLPSERRRIFALLTITLSNYIFLFLPFALTALLATLKIDMGDYYYYFALAANLLLYLSPMINPFLSMLLTRNLRELLDTLPCCRSKRDLETGAAGSAVVIENPHVVSPMAITASSGFENPGHRGMMVPEDGGMMTSGVSTVLGNFGAVFGMQGSSPQAPSLLGGLTAFPNMVALPNSPKRPGSFEVFSLECAGEAHDDKDISEAEDTQDEPAETGNGIKEMMAQKHIPKERLSTEKKATDVPISEDIKKQLTRESISNDPMISDNLTTISTEPEDYGLSTVSTDYDISTRL